MIAKHGKTILFASLIAAMVLSFNMTGATSPAEDTDGEKEMSVDKRFDAIKEFDDKIKYNLSEFEKIAIHENIKSDKTTSKYFKDDVTKHGYSYFGNVDELNEDPDKMLDVVMHYSVDGKALSVLVDGQTKQVIESKTYKENSGLLPDNGLIVSGYKGVLQSTV